MHYQINLIAGWAGFLAGAGSGALLGLFFHRENWLGGYGSFPRRLTRLGHIAFFGVGLINILFAFSAQQPSWWADWASRLLVVGLISMPTNCFLTAFVPFFRNFFFIPVASIFGGIAALLVHLS